jgi:hypothetical protein
LLYFDALSVKAIERTRDWALLLLMARIDHDPATSGNAGSGRGVCRRCAHLGFVGED